MSRSRKSGSDPHEEEGSLSILEAVENLSNIAEMDIDDKIGLIEDHVIVHGATEDEVLEAIQWLEDKSEHQTEKVVEETYKAVLKYVKEFHQKEFNRFYDSSNQENLKKIMLLVGKASDKLKNFTHLFKSVHQQGIEETKEYQQLNRFYNERIAIDEGEKVSLIDLSRKERQLEAQKHPQIEEDENALKAKQFALDVEKSKEDDFYELLYIQRDDGTNFTEPNFYRNIKVACNFGEYIGKKAERNPLEGLENWLDMSYHRASVRILKILKPNLKAYYQDALKYKDMELVSSVNMALMALMLAANPKNRMNANPAKSATRFFKDFQHYIRLALGSFEYQKLRSFPPPSNKVFLTQLLDIVNLLSWSLFFHGVDMQSLTFALDDILEEGRVSVKRKGYQKVTKGDFWKAIEEDYIHVQRYLMAYPVGPLFKTLHELSNMDYEGFDAIGHGNLPMEFQRICYGDIDCSILRLPTPTTQEVISQVRLCPEFIGLIDAYSQSSTDRKHLMINLQDRCDWKEFARATFLEKVPQKSEFVGCVDTVSLSKNSDFYQQSGAYQGIDKAKDFFKQLVFNLHSKETGFYFPKWMEKQLFSGFIEKIIQKIHRFFFEGKSKLSQKERQNFIEIFYQFLSLKILEITNATSMSFTCKDALDTGAIQTLSFYSFFRLLSESELSEKDRQKMHLLLFAFPLIMRSRPSKAQGFLRMVQCLRFVEERLKKHSKGQAFKAFNEFFDKPLEELTFAKPSFDDYLKS